MLGSMTRNLAFCGAVVYGAFASPAFAQDQLTSALGAVSGGNAGDSFVLIGAGGPEEVGVASIEDSKISTIECVHVGGIISFAPDYAFGANGTLIVEGGSQLSTNLIDLGSSIAAHASLHVRDPGTRILDNPIGHIACAGGRPFNVTVIASRGTASALVTNRAELNNLFMTLGRDPGATGSLNVTSPSACDSKLEPKDFDCSQIRFVESGLSGGQLFPGFLTVGRNGTGQVSLSNARIRMALDGATVPPAANAGAGFNLGRNVGGLGSMSLNEGSKVLLESAGEDPNDFGFVGVGRSGTGILKVTGNSLLEVQGENSAVLVARKPGSVGTVHLRDAGSTIDVEGLFGLSMEFDGTDGGISTLVMDADTVINAGEFESRANSTIFSNGTINAASMTIGGIFNPGFSPGSATLNGNVTVTSTGVIRLEVVGTGGSGGTDQVVVSGNLTVDGGMIEVVLQDGAQLEDLETIDLIDADVVSGEADIVILEEDGDVVANLDGTNLDEVDLGGEGGFSVTDVQIDIKPESSENTINLGSNGNLTVAILGSQTFDVATVIPSSVRLSGAEIRLRGKGTFATNTADVNGDGLVDLVVHVPTDALDLSSSSEVAMLSGTTTDGSLFQGSDLIRIVPSDS